MNEYTGIINTSLLNVDGFQSIYCVFLVVKLYLGTQNVVILTANLISKISNSQGETFVFIICLAMQAGKTNQIPRCDWHGYPRGYAVKLSKWKKITEQLGQIESMSKLDYKATARFQSG